jgi:hypothetical protein
MSTVRLVPDLNEMIIAEFVHDYPTFRRFLLTIGNDQAQIAYYFRKYMPKFITNEYIAGCHVEYLEAGPNFEVSVNRQKNGLKKYSLRVRDGSGEVPFFEKCSSIKFFSAMKNLKAMSAYSQIETVEICWNVEISAKDFVDAFPNLHEFRSYNKHFIDQVLAIHKKIKHVYFTKTGGMSKELALKYPNVEFHSVYDRFEYILDQEVNVAPIAKNLKCALIITDDQIDTVDIENFCVESLRISVNRVMTSPLVIPTRFKDLRFLTVALNYRNPPNVDVIIDGFQCLELIDIYSNDETRATCRIANVPYIFCLRICSKRHTLDIDYKTVSIFEQRI